jgi:hypothetical protein
LFTVAILCTLCSAVCRRQIDRAEAQAFADENGLSYVEASAKNADGVDEAFMSTCEKVRTP